MEAVLHICKRINPHNLPPHVAKNIPSKILTSLKFTCTLQLIWFADI